MWLQGIKQLNRASDFPPQKDNAFMKPLACIDKTLFFIFHLLFCPFALSESFINIEASVFSPNYNKVQIPNNNQGSRFDITTMGDGPIPAARLTYGWLAASKHELQLVLAPFS